MTEWEVVGVIIALVGLVGVFVKITFNVSTTLTKLTVTLENLQLCLMELEASKKETHKRIFGRLEGHETLLNDHECRIKILEGEIKHEN